MIITILRKPLEGSVADNVLKHGCGAINIDATRIITSDNLNGGAYAESANERHDGKENWRYERGKAGDYVQPSGRWPANFILTHREGCELKGKKKIKEGKVNKDKGGSLREVGLYEDGLKIRAIDNFQGEEEVSDWECVDGCPIKALDEQSGVLRAGEEGGASRFFKQFKTGNN